jgi:hypothetical protein
MRFEMTRVIKVIRGRSYYYNQISRRVNGKVKTTTEYIGPVNPRRARAAKPERRLERGPDWYKMEQEMARQQAAEQAKTDAFNAKMHDLYGMNPKTYDAPIEKHVPNIDFAAIENAPEVGAKSEASETSVQSEPSDS